MTGRGNQVRVFVALDLTPNDKVRLTDTITHLQQSIASGVPVGRPPGNSPDPEVSRKY